MKKLIIVLFFLALVSPVFAQNNSNDEEGNPNVYYANVPVEKIYLAGTGYVVQYRMSTSQIGTIGIPYSWFTDAASTAELVRLPKGPNWPNMSIFYKDGNFSHIRLYVHGHKSHQTWGVTPQGADVSRYFPEDKDSFNFKF
ncbi:MAG: hypothetical protein LBI04_07885 [Treponema sp.]|jgi:hypothetical protein|nr:hypothetical protein [Treponema sp.]